MDAIEEAGINVAQDHGEETVEKMVAHVNKPVYVSKNDSFVAAFPALETRITCGIDFPQVQSYIFILRNTEEENKLLSSRVLTLVLWFMMKHPTGACYRLPVVCLET